MTARTPTRTLAETCDETAAEGPAARVPAALAGLCAAAAGVQPAVIQALDAWQVEVVAALLRGLPA